MVLGIIELQIDPQLLGGLLEGGRIGGPPATLGTGLDETHDHVRVGVDLGRLFRRGGRLAAHQEQARQQDQNECQLVAQHVLLSLSLSSLGVSSPLRREVPHRYNEDWRLSSRRWRESRSPRERPLGDLNHQAGASFSRAAIHWTAAPPLPQFPWGAMSSGVRPTL